MDHVSHPVMSSLILFYSNLLHLLIMWLIVSSLSLHNLHLLFCSVLSIIIIIIILLAYFSHQIQLMVFHRGLSDSKSSKVSKTLLSILADLDNAKVLIVLIHPLISKSSSPFSQPLETVPNAKLQKVLASPSCSIGFSLLWHGTSNFSLFAFFDYHCMVLSWQVLFYLFIYLFIYSFY